MEANGTQVTITTHVHLVWTVCLVWTVWSTESSPRRRPPLTPPNRCHGGERHGDRHHHSRPLRRDGTVEDDDTGRAETLPRSMSSSLRYGGRWHGDHHHRLSPLHRDGIVEDDDTMLNIARDDEYFVASERCHSRPRHREDHRHTHFAHFIEPVTWSTKPQSHPGRRLPMISSNRRQSQGAPPPPRFGTGVVPLLHYARTQWCLGDVVTRA